MPMQNNKQTQKKNNVNNEANTSHVICIPLYLL